MQAESKKKHDFTQPKAVKTQAEIDEWLNLKPNPDQVYEVKKDADGKSIGIHAIKEEPSSLKNRRDKFNHPPSFMIDELTKDEIKDKWECKAKSLAEIARHANQCWDYQPRIGILTQPTADKNRPIFDKDQYILEVNDNFVRWAGSIPVAIPYDISPEELSKVLS